MLGHLLYGCLIVNQRKFPGEVADGGDTPQNSVSSFPLLQHQHNKGQEAKEVSTNLSSPLLLKRAAETILSAPPHPAS